MKFEEIKLAPGYPLQLQTSSVDGEVKRVNSRYLGALPGKYLLVTPPANTRFRTGQKLAVRAMVANGIAMLSTTVETTVNTPVSMLCLSYPAAINFKEIRGATRVTVNLEASVTNISEVTGSSVAGQIADVSTTGAKIELKDVVGDVGQELELKAQVTIGNIQRTMLLKAVIRARIDRSTKELDEEFPAVYGIEFKGTDEENQLLLHAYVYREMVAQ